MGISTQEIVAGHSFSGLSKDTLTYGIALILERIISFLIIPVITKSLPPEFYGIWSQILVTIGILSPLVLLGFCSAIVRFLAGENSPYQKAKIFNWMTIAVLISCAVIGGIGLLFKSQVSSLIFGYSNLYKYVYLLFLFLLIDSFFELAMSLLRAERKIFRLSVYYFIKHTIRPLALFVVLWVFHWEFWVSLLVIAIMQMCVIVWVYYREIFSNIGAIFSFESVPVREILSFSLPLVPYALSMWGNNFLNRYIVVYILGLKEVSIYGVVWSLASISVVFYSAIGYILYPYLTKSWEIKDIKAVKSNLEKGIFCYLFFVFPLPVILTFFNKEIISLISTSYYIPDWKTTFLISFSVLLFGLYQISIFSVLLKKQTVLVFWTSFIALIINILFSLWLIPKFGLVGAGISLVLSNAFLAGWALVMTKRIVDFRLNWQSAGKILFTSLGMMIVFLSGEYFLKTKLNDFFVLVSVITAGLLTYVFLNLIGKNSFVFEFFRSKFLKENRKI